MVVRQHAPSDLAQRRTLKWPLSPRAKRRERYESRYVRANGGDNTIDRSRMAKHPIPLVRPTHKWTSAILACHKILPCPANLLIPLNPASWYPLAAPTVLKAVTSGYTALTSIRQTASLP